MTVLDFSIYGDQPSPLEDPSFLLKAFQAQHHVDVHITRMAWNEAWPKLLSFALYGGGPHISQIGAIWTSTLVAMNALRPFSRQEITALGGTDAFFAPTWQSAILPDRPEVWGVPFTAFTYIVLYRRDLLKRAGIAEQTAFESAGAMLETLKRLQAAGIRSPLVLPSGNPYRGRVHMAASWIWGSRGDFVSDDGQRALFDQPEARAGLKTFFEMYRYMPPSDHNLTYEECLRRFATGEAAVTIAGSGTPGVVRDRNVRQVLDNLGITVAPGVPWIGGSNIVVWREAQMALERERAALALAQLLTSATVQIKYATAGSAIPTRVEALPHLRLTPPSVSQVFDTALRMGRSYKPALIWVRMLGDLSRAFDAITTDILADTARDVSKTLDKHLVPLAQRFNLMLSK